MSDIRVFVTFPESPSVFAGETLSCKITFKNVAPAAGSAAAPSQHGSPIITSNVLGRIDRRGKISPLQLPSTDRRSSRVSPRIPQSASFQSAANHKPHLSLGVPTERPPPQLRTAADFSGPGNKHRRSVSIISLGSDVGNASPGGRGGEQSLEDLRSPQSATGRPHSRKHERSISLHIIPRRGSATATPASSCQNTQPSSPAIRESDPMANFSFPRRTSTPTTPRTPRASKPTHQRPATAHKSFKFPSVPLAPESSGDQSVKVTQNGLKSPIDTDYEHVPSSRIISAHSVNGETPRSSGEFYALSNSTTDTLASEYSQAPPRPVRTNSSHGRRYSLLSLSPSLSDTTSDSLMMGYAHVSGSFTLDGSLIDSGLFEDVKRKAAVGAQMGSGVVGMETNKSEGGFLSGFGWGGWSGLLGGNGNMSSIAEMKNVTNSRSVPILSTPRSILFVDLQLGPGESKSYGFKFPLPRSLPPSHKGKAIKISYNLVVGTQRPGKGVQQQPKVVEIPFRLLPAVDITGATQVHNLMSPVVLLRDEATTTNLDKGSPGPIGITSKPPKQESSLDGFLSYVDTLLVPDNGLSSALGLLSPTFNPSRRDTLYDVDEHISPKEAIDMCVLRHGGKESMFEIARNGYRVASLTLARPAYKLGETITAVLDFSNAQIPCRQLNVSLESAEAVKSNLALRSAASIQRATRKVYCQHSESTLFTRRVLFTPTIPASATPTFATSGCALSWSLRLEFVTPAMATLLPAADGRLALGYEENLLELAAVDERGEVYHPRQALQVESFDACIPVKVYPNAADVASLDAQATMAATVGFPV